MTTAREAASKLAQTYIDAGDPLGWFEALYGGAQGDNTQIPWADLSPNRNLTAWVERQAPVGPGKQALVVGCGLGDDAEYLANLGYQVTAFDLAPSAVGWCKKRFAVSAVQYSVGDVLNTPATWEGAFDFIHEAYTLQVMPDDLRARAMRNIAGCLTPGGTLLVIARGREPGDEKGTTPPWPLTRADLAGFNALGLREKQFEDYPDGEARRFRATYQR